MAPFWGPGLEETIRRLHENPTQPITLGRGEPSHHIAYLDGAWTIAPLIVNEVEAEKAAKAAIAAGRPWMPEMESQFKAPGEAMIRHSELDAFIADLEDWWPERLG